MDKREKFIIDCVNALQEVNNAHGYSVISQETLAKIVLTYAQHYNSPALPGKRSRSQPSEEFEMSDKIINLFDRAREVKKDDKEQTEEEMDFAAIMKKNQENAERMKKDRRKANKGVTRSYRLKKD